jgi:hypothetical protein
LSQALDRLARENGMDMSWADAVASLRSDPMLPGCASVYAPDLIEIRKETIKRYKGGDFSGSLEQALTEACRSFGYAQPGAVAQLAYVPMIKTCFHVIKAGPMRLQFWVGTNAEWVAENDRALHVSGDLIPEKAYQRDPGYRRPNVEWGDVTSLEDDPEDTESTWHICKYNISQKRIPLVGADKRMAFFVHEQTGIGGFEFGQKFRRFEAELASPTFASLARYAKTRSRLVKGATNVYFPDWGDQALGAAKEAAE